MYGTAEVKSEAGKLILYFNSKPMGVLDHWHYDTFKVNPEASGSLRFIELLENSLVTFSLNALGKVAGMEIEEMAVFERSPEPQEKKN
jgi:hypothetical protein